MNYKFSVVMPLYQAAPYLEEAVSCIIDQSIGFSDNIQIVMVDDGSTDQTEEICGQLIQRWPEQIRYIKKENGGVSSARNLGIKSAEGNYVVFFDYDDIWEKDAFQKIDAFFEQNANVDVVCCKLEFMGDFAGKEHPLDYKFAKGTRVVDLLKEPEYVNSTIGNMVFRQSAIGGHRYDENLPTGEDATFTNTILLNNPMLGIVADAVFYYRRNIQKGSVSTSAPSRKTWYFEVPEHYYLKLIEESGKRFGKTLPFIQEVILYDMRWRHYNKRMMTVLTEEEKERHVEIMHNVLSNIDDQRITGYEQINQYRRLYYFYLKYGNDLQKECSFSDRSARYEGTRVLNYGAKSMLQIVMMRVDGNRMILDGYHRLHTVLSDLELRIRDDRGREHAVTAMPYPDIDQRGYIGEWVMQGMQFHAVVPLDGISKIGFFTKTEEFDWQLSPNFWSDSRLDLKGAYRFCKKGDYLFQVEDKWITVQPFEKGTYNKLKLRSKARDVFRKEHEQYQYLQGRLSLQEIWDKSSLKDQVAFVTPRSNDRLLPNLRAVYEACEQKKVMHAAMAPYEQHELEEMARVIFESKVVVTDDYLALMRLHGKKPGQKIVQIWHAAGAFKRFGLDGTSLFPAIEASYHRDYDLVSVSAEGIRDIYANTFGIDTDKVKALGVPRTDCMFQEAHVSDIQKSVYKRYPDFKDKQILLYAPTFRDGGDLEKYTFVPDIDFDRLSGALLPDQVFLICPHPVMENDIVPGNYPNIRVIRDIPTGDMLCVADLLITDYSSVIFEYAIFRKPIVFYCYDYDDYNRNFYLDYEHDLPGEVLQTQDELIAYLQKGEFTPDERLGTFYQKYMGACDGHSTERILEEIDKFMVEGKEA